MATEELHLDLPSEDESIYLMYFQYRNHTKASNDEKDSLVRYLTVRIVRISFHCTSSHHLFLFDGTFLSKGNLGFSLINCIV